jgi:capsular polysaccharide biosynthesis protein
MLARFIGWVQRKQLYPGEHIVRPWPCNLQERDRAFFAKNREYDLPPSWLLRLREVSLYWDGVAFHGLQLYPETLVLPNRPEHNWRGLLYMHLRLRRQRLPANRRYVLVHDAWSGSYYHWMVDALPRLLAIREQVPGAVLLLPEYYQQDYQHKTIAALGVEEIAQLHPHTRYVVPQLVAPSRLARVASYNPGAMRELRQVLLAKFPLLPQADLGDRIYISRAQAPRRKVLNEAAVTTCLRELGFAVVQLEDYGFAEQVSIMARARYLISIHGAGLTNMLFMPPGSKVLELQMQDDGTNHYYYTLAADLSIDYYYQFCLPNDPDLTVQDADLTVNVEELRQLVGEMLAAIEKQ